MPPLKEEVATALRSGKAPASTLGLWDEIAATFARGGPASVESLIARKVQEIKREARAEAREMKAAAGAVRGRGRPKKK